MATATTSSESESLSLPQLQQSEDYDEDADSYDAGDDAGGDAECGGAYGYGLTLTYDPAP